MSIDTIEIAKAVYEIGIGGGINVGDCTVNVERVDPGRMWHGPVGG